MTDIKLSGNVITTSRFSREMSEKILDASRINDDLVVIVLDSDDPARMNERFSNIKALNASGNLTWEAELPSDHPTDSYWSVTLGNPILAMSFSSFRCEIDPATGKILRKIFYK